jgi:hypothetical protein
MKASGAAIGTGVKPLKDEHGQAVRRQLRAMRNRIVVEEQGRCKRLDIADLPV